MAERSADRPEARGPRLGERLSHGSDCGWATPAVSIYAIEQGETAARVYISLLDGVRIGEVAGLIYVIVCSGSKLAQLFQA